MATLPNPWGPDRQGLLEPDELRTLRGFLLRVAAFLIYAAIPWLFGTRPGEDVPARLVVAFSVGGGLAMLAAILLGEQAGRGKLNHWDEAMAFNGLTLLVHLARTVLVHG